MHSAKTTRPIRRPAIAVSVWLLAASCLLVAMRAVVPSDGLAREQPSGAFIDGSYVVTANRPVDDVRSGERIVAIDGRTVDELLAHPRSRPARSGDTHSYLVESAGGAGRRDVVVRVRGARDLLAMEARNNWALLAFVPILGLGTWLIRRRPDEPAATALFLSGACLVSLALASLGFAEPLDLLARPWLVGWSYATLAGFTTLAGAALLFAQSFPAARAGATHRVASVLVVAPSLVLALLGVTVAAVGSTSAVLQRADDVAGLWSLVVTVAAMAVFAIRWRRLRADPALRRRVQLVAIGFACTFLPIILANLAPFHLPEALFVLLLLPFPASVAAAVARRDLFDLDVAVNRTLVAVLSGGVLLVLYLLVVGVAVKVTGDSGPLVALPAAGVVAVSFAPVRDAVRRMINRRLHGSVSDPSRVFHRMGVRLSAAADPDALLTALVETINDALRLPFGAIEVTTAEGWQVAEQRGRPTPVVERFDVVSGDEVVGRLAVSPRRDTGVLSTRDRQLLEDLARHSGVALRVASLLTELRTAQQRVRLASEQERHRIHRDLHDGVGPVLVGLALQLEVAADMAAGTPLGGLLARLHGEAARTIEDIRRLVKDLRPLELDQLGLATAVAAAAERLRSGGHPHIQVEAPPRLPACTPPVEDAAYKICLEAMSNAVRHSGATMCVLSIGTTGPGQLRIDVHDDGHGFEAAAGAGTGLQSMRERAAAVGGTVTIASDAGGTRIEATLPTGTL